MTVSPDPLDDASFLKSPIWQLSELGGGEGGGVFEANPLISSFISLVVTCGVDCNVAAKCI